MAPAGSTPRFRREGKEEDHACVRTTPIGVYKEHGVWQADHGEGVPRQYDSREEAESAADAVAQDEERELITDRTLTASFAASRFAVDLVLGYFSCCDSLELKQPGENLLEAEARSHANAREALEISSSSTWKPR